MDWVERTWGIIIIIIIFHTRIDKLKKLDNLEDLDVEEKNEISEVICSRQRKYDNSMQNISQRS